jgi:hypothetical protein
MPEARAPMGRKLVTSRQPLGVPLTTSLRLTSGARLHQLKGHAATAGQLRPRLVQGDRRGGPARYPLLRHRTMQRDKAIANAMGERALAELRLNSGERARRTDERS